MTASQIPDTLKQFIDKGNPYHCVLIDGPWGIGKSYQISKTLKDIHTSADVSLFGANSLDEVLLQLAIQICDDSKSGENQKKENQKKKIKKSSMNAILKLPTIIGDVDFGSISSIGKLISRAITPKTVIDYVLSHYTGENPFLIVFDDLERINGEKFDLDEFLGAIETFLLKKTNVKILLIANLEQMSLSSKEIWEKYSEKIINRTYYIDELSEKIDFFLNQADNEMALSFMKKHRSQNLRTLQKANNLYEDILYRLTESGVQLSQEAFFLNSLRHACYAVVFELTEKIYEQKFRQWEKGEQDGEQDKDSYNNAVCKAFNRSEHSRICHNYLSNDSLAIKFVSPITEYLKKGNFVPEAFVSSYDEYVSNDKPTYYKSDEEVLKDIEKIRSDLLNHKYQGIVDLVKKADSAFIWCEVMQMNADDVEKCLCNELPNEYKKLLEEKGKPDSSVGSILPDDVQSDRTKTLIKNFAQQEVAIYENFLISQVESALSQNDYNKILRLLNNISSALHNKPPQQEIENAEAFTRLLCSEQLLPIGSISEIQYFCCKDAYKLATKYFHDIYQKFIQAQTEKHKSSKMFCDRMQHIQQDQDYSIPENE